MKGATLQATIHVTGTLDDIHSLIKKHGGMLISAETTSDRSEPIAPPSAKHRTGMSKASRNKQSNRLAKSWAEVRRHGFKTLAELKAYKAKAAKRPAKKGATKKPAKKPAAPAST